MSSVLCGCCGVRVRRGGPDNPDEDEDEEKILIVEQPTAHGALGNTHHNGNGGIGLTGLTGGGAASSTAAGSAAASGKSASGKSASASGPLGGETDDFTRGKRMFNVSPEKGMKFLQANGLVGTTPDQVALFLRESMFLDKSKIGDYISNPGEYYDKVLQSFVDSQSFANMEFDVALRKLLEAFRLPGEAQKIDRIMQKFANSYCSANGHVFASSDTAYILAFSLIMLNTDLHNPSIKNRMTKQAFIKNNRGINQGEDLPFEMLSHLYDAFRQNELQMDEGITYIDSAYTFFNPEREGVLWKLSSKMRGWNRRFFVITGNCLYYFKNQEDKDPGGIIPLEDLSVREVDLAGVFELDTTPKFCFELYDANKEGIPKATIKAVKRAGGTLARAKHTTYIFAADSLDERSEWIRCIRANMAPPPIFSLMDRRRRMMKGGSSGGSGGVASNGSAGDSKHGSLAKLGGSGSGNGLGSSASSTPGPPQSLSNIFSPVLKSAGGNDSEVNLVSASPASEGILSPQMLSPDLPSIASAMSAPVSARDFGRPYSSSSQGSLTNLPKSDSVLSFSSSGSLHSFPGMGISVAPPVSAPAAGLDSPRRISADAVMLTPTSSQLALSLHQQQQPLQQPETPLTKFRSAIGAPPSSATPRTRGHNRSISDTTMLGPASPATTDVAPNTAPVAMDDDFQLDDAESTTSTPSTSSNWATVGPVRDVITSFIASQPQSAATDAFTSGHQRTPSAPLSAGASATAAAPPPLGKAPRVGSSLRTSVVADGEGAIIATPSPVLIDSIVPTSGPGSDVSNEVLANVFQQEQHVDLEEGTSQDSDQPTTPSKAASTYQHQAPQPVDHEEEGPTSSLIT